MVNGYCYELHQSTCCTWFLFTFFGGFLSCYVASVIVNGLIYIAHLELAQGEFAVVNKVFTFIPLLTTLLTGVDKAKLI